MGHVPAEPSIRGPLDIESTHDEHGVGLFLTSTIFDVGVECFIDSGSSLTVLHPNKYKDMSDEIKPPLRPVSSQIRLADGGLQAIHGEVELPFTFGMHTFVHPVVVAEVEAPAILGLDFLEKHNGILDAHQEILTLGTVAHQCFKASEKDKIFNVVMNDTCIIPPNSDCKVPGWINGYPHFTSGTIEPAESFLKSCLLVAKSVVNPSVASVPLSVLNINSDLCTVYKDTVIGVCEPIQEVVMTLSDTSAHSLKRVHVDSGKSLLVKAQSFPLTLVSFNFEWDPGGCMSLDQGKMLMTCLFQPFYVVDIVMFLPYIGLVNITLAILLRKS